MSWLDLLGSIFGAGSTAAGASSGGGMGLSGLAGILGPITGASTPSASSAGTNALLTALGGLASKYKATPLAGATEDEIKRANRENLIAGALGALMTGYGQYSQEQAKQQALGGLADILAKGPQTPQGPVQPGQTMTPISMSQQIAQWTQQNPQYAELGLKTLQTTKEAEQQALLKRLELQQKLVGGSGDYLQALTIAEKEGIPPEMRAGAAQAILAEKGQKRLAALEPYRSDLAAMGVQLPTAPKPSEPLQAQLEATTQQRRTVEEPPIFTMPSIRPPISEGEIAEAENILGQPLAKPPGTPVTREDYQRQAQALQLRERTLAEEGKFEDQLGKLQSSEGYKETIGGLRKQSQVLSKLTAFTEEVAKRPKGELKPQDRIQLAKLAIQAIEPGLSVNEGEAAAALKPDSEWWNSYIGQKVSSIFGRNEIPVDSVDTLLKTTGAYVQAKQNDAQAYLQDEVIPLYQDRIFGDKIISAVTNAIPKTDPLKSVESALEKLRASQGLGNVPLGYGTGSKTKTQAMTASGSELNTQPIQKASQVIGYVGGRPVIGIVKR